MNSEFSMSEHLGLEWKEGKRYFTLANKGYSDKVYDIMELYQAYIAFSEDLIKHDLTGGGDRD